MKDEATAMSTPALISEDRIASQRAAGITRYTAEEVNNAITDLWRAEQEYRRLMIVAGSILDKHMMDAPRLLYDDAPQEAYSLETLTYSDLIPNGAIFASRGSSDMYAVRKVRISIRKYYALNRRLEMAIDKYNKRKVG